MIGQYLSNKNKSATVTKSKKFLDPKWPDAYTPTRSSVNGVCVREAIQAFFR
jgi:hypothetical protein